MAKKVFVTKEKAQAIAAQYPTPFYLYDEAGIRERCQQVKDAFSWNKGFREYFAVKATPNPYIISILKEYGFGCDCSSEAELRMAEAIGATGDLIMFSSNETPPHEFKYCNELGGIINLDDITHIETIKEVIGDKFPETMSCRFNPGGVFTLSNGIMDNPGDAKYGMTEAQLFDAYRQMKEHGVKKFGIHAFLASNTVTNEYYPALAGQLFELVVRIKNELDIEFAFVNLSGGVGIGYKPEDTQNDISVIGAGVKEQFEKILVPAGMGDVAIYTEMGRYMLAPYGALITKAIHEKHTYKDYIGVDATAANLMRPAIYGAYHHVTVLGKEDAPHDHKYNVVGALCENCDQFAKDRMLPEIEKGDLLFIHDAGAHGFAMGYNYNGRLWSAEILLQADGEAKLIRRAQTINDYYATFDCTEFGDKLIK